MYDTCQRKIDCAFQIHSRSEAPGNILGDKTAYPSGGLFGGPGSHQFFSFRLGASLACLLTAVITDTLTFALLSGQEPHLACPLPYHLLGLAHSKP